MLAGAGMRPIRQWRNRPQGRASSIQPSLASRYNFAKARISSWSWAGSMPENRYAALLCARKEIAVGFAQADMHSKVSMLKARIAGSSALAKSVLSAVANASPWGSVASSRRQLEQMNTVGGKQISLILGYVLYIPLAQDFATSKLMTRRIPFTITNQTSC